MAEGIVGRTVEGLGDYLKEQRVSAALSLRQLADQAGVSNAYLSMVERGLRNPSAHVLQQIAKALEISAEQVYVQAGILQPGPADRTVEPVPAPPLTVEAAIRADDRLTEEQQQALLTLYSTFLDPTGPGDGTD